MGCRIFVFKPSKVIRVNMMNVHSSKLRLVLLAVLTTGFLFSSLPHSNVQAAAGDLDTTFGTGGKVTTLVGTGSSAHDLVIQPDGKIIICGGANLGGNRILLIRYNNDGSLDNTFGTGGIATLVSALDARAMALQADGKIVIAGSTGSEIPQIFMLRFNNDGSLDTGFGSGGMVQIGIGNPVDVAIQPDAKIVVLTKLSLPVVLSIFRYNTNGTLDPTFGTAGSITASLNGIADNLALQADGKIVAAGFVSAPKIAGRDAIVLRFNNNGSPDASFGTVGRVTTDIGGMINEARALAIAPDGRLAVSGYVDTDSHEIETDHDFALYLYNSDGSLDTTFGSDGIVTTKLTESNDVAEAVAVHNNKIIAAGTSFGTFAVARYNLDGSLDPAFGMGGVVITDFSADRSEGARALAIQSDGKLVAAGHATISNSVVVAMARYLNDSVSFDLCLRDDSSGSFLQVNSITGEYLFTNCNGVTLGGTGTLSKRGCLITLQANTSERKVLARIDTCTRNGTASVQLFSPFRVFTISNRGSINGLCSCPSQ
jgi:uncharacterized delta-60 repeat protein